MGTLKIEALEIETLRMNYKGVLVTIGKDGSAHADYPNNKENRVKLDKIWNRDNRSNAKRELSSDNKRYRAYYPHNSLGKLFSDIDEVIDCEDNL